MSRKKILKALSLCLAVCFLFASLLSGCGQAKPQDAGTAEESARTDKDSNTESKSAKKAKLRFLTRFSGNDATTPVLQAMIKEFTEKNPDVEIQDDSVNDEASFNNKLTTGIATGDVPNMFQGVGVMSMVEYAKNGVIMDVSPLMEDKEWFDGFVKGSFDTWKYDDYGVKGYYGVPFSLGIENFYYNKDIFAKAGITKTPETMDELYDVIDKLKAINVIPWGVGAKATWRAGHVFNFLLYKWAGIEKARDIGVRKAKWTDPEVVEALNLFKDLKARGAFEKNFEGIDYDQEKANFFSGKYGMVLNGDWFIGDCINSEIKDKIGVFPFPYFKEKPQFKGNAVVFPQGLELSGKAQGAEKEAQIKWIKFMTGKLWQENMVKQIQRTPARTDANLEGAQLSDTFKTVIGLLDSVEVPAGDTFDLDPLPSMQDRTRNSLIGMLLKNSAEDAAKEIQTEIDKSSN